MSDWSFDITRKEWVNAKTGVRYTDAQVRTMTPVVQTSITGANPRVVPGAQPLGYDQDDGPLKATLFIPKIVKGTCIRFVTHNRYTYLALYMPSRDPLGHWYITGNGKWFGTNELTTEQMSEVLMRDTTSEIRIMSTSHEDAHARLT
jgi:hypothetical protein